MDRVAEKEKSEPLLRARSWGMGNPVLWVHPTQPPCATTQLCPFPIAHFPSLPSLQAAIPECLHLTKKEQFHEDRDCLATWGETDTRLCCLLHGRDGGLRALLSVGMVLWNLVHSLTRGQTAAPKGSVKSFSLEKSISLETKKYSASVWFMAASWWSLMIWKGIFIDWESTGTY